MAATPDHYDVIVIGSGPGGASLAHRLAGTGKRILMLERGRVLDFAPHPVLVERCESYRRLWQQQTRHLQ